MKNKIINVISAILIIVSLILIVRYFIVSNNYQNSSQQTYYEEEEYPMTQAECVNGTVDLGKVAIGNMISQKYVIRNTGENPLVVQSLSPDCNCTDYKVSQYVAQPRDSIVVTLYVDTEDKKLGETALNTVIQLNTEEKNYLLTLICELINPD